MLLSVLEESLRLLHPLLPFVTEEIYGKLPNVRGMLITAAYPRSDDGRRDAKVEADFAAVQELVRLVRALRGERKIRVLVRLEGSFASADALQANAPLAELLAGIAALEFSRDAAATRPAGSIGVVGKGFEAFVFIREAVDPAQLAAKFAKDIEKDRKFLATLEAKLANDNFVKNAPVELVDAEKGKLDELLRRIAKFEAYARDLA